MAEKRRRTATEWLLTYFGPAQVGNIRSRRRPVSDAARATRSSTRTSCGSSGPTAGRSWSSATTSDEPLAPTE